MGLGLAATLNILQSHKAHIDVSSTVGEGTTFVIAFPTA
jgi:signal transduction histidine kinase